MSTFLAACRPPATPTTSAPPAHKAHAGVGSTRRRLAPPLAAAAAAAVAPTRGGWQAARERWHHGTRARPAAGNPQLAARAAASASPSTAQAQAGADAEGLPRSPGAMVDQAAAAVRAALDAGITRQTVTFLLPVNEKEADFNNTEPQDYPCSLQKEFDTACALAKSLLQRVLGGGLGIAAKRIDDGGVEGEPCGVLFPEDKSFVAVVFPTADRLKQLQAYAKTEGRPLLIVNPQWRNEGQVVSDFGFGPWRKAAEDFLATFEQTYFLREKRIGSPGTIDAATGTRFVSGGVLRVLRLWPGQYQSHAMAANGASQLMEATPAEPNYQECDAMIKRGRAAKLDIFRVAREATALSFGGGEEAGEEAADGGGGGGGGGEALAGLSDADIEAMDAATLRRLLLGAGLPGSGRIPKLRERLREARDGAK